MTVAELVEAYGLGTADQIEAPSSAGHTVPWRPPLVEAVPRRARRSKDELEAERALGHWFVCVVGYESAVPRRFGDNQGVLPMKIELHADWADAGRLADPESPMVPLARWATICCRNRDHGKRLKGELDEMLLGREQSSEAVALRRAWRDCCEFGEFERWWPVLLNDALIACELWDRSFFVASIAEHDDEVHRLAAKIARQRAERMGVAA